MDGSAIREKILEIRGVKVLLDYTLAEMYEVETRVLNQAVKRNADIFPSDFMFRLSKAEWEAISSQIVMTSSQRPKITTALCLHRTRCRYACHCAQKSESAPDERADYPCFHRIEALPHASS